jgi:hypothetical protein
VDTQDEAGRGAPTRVCPKCSLPADAEADYCSRCGSSLVERTDAERAVARGTLFLAWGAALVIVFALAYGWRAGTFDNELVHVGLNAKPCIRTLQGARFCGGEAKSWCETTDPVRSATEGLTTNDQLSSSRETCEEIERAS